MRIEEGHWRILHEWTCGKRGHEVGGGRLLAENVRSDGDMQSTNELPAGVIDMFLINLRQGQLSAHLRWLKITRSKRDVRIDLRKPRALLTFESTIQYPLFIRKKKHRGEDVRRALTNNECVVQKGSQKRVYSCNTPSGIKPNCFPLQTPQKSSLEAIDGKGTLSRGAPRCATM
ncbi:hypothetical protein AUEXF2481DRAFT_534537 [Aureobasidium subglaciale EXF-2481]|uniref:Uncharacterized protein n=1 Tax=Aureobasidium subglaciale (strain EXF-2481) TaxID=1043005 RepID=A0A074XZ30_AURSE|nr:uncharacterized protein AUEXF2481DRAFT_534537 [Aureobasidium subglaciale EXF-2481]KEQ90690.1 hypothetical protein AUEXF2481DRAFT_534537 [Aureobasidium subglaciale EXF-2481]